MSNLRNLREFVEEANNWRKYQNKPAMTFPLSQDEINDIADSLDCKMSPENLHCDGEISARQAGLKAGRICRAFAELKQHAKDQGLTITVQTYELQ